MKTPKQPKTLSRGRRASLLLDNREMKTKTPPKSKQPICTRRRAQVSLGILD
jgi:hypothetical protein